MKRLQFWVCYVCFSLVITSMGIAQDLPSLSGSLQSNTNLFIRDNAIGANNTPQYDHQLVGGETWLDLVFSYKGFDVGLRADLFFNSNLLNPNDSYSDQGIGRWYIRKKMEKLEIEVGYIYDQIGSGIIFRAYEERPLLIDNALFGISAKYNFSDNLSLKAFTGKQKQLFDVYSSTLKGINLDGFIFLGKSNNVSLAPGIGLIGKTLSDRQMEDLISTVQTYTPEDSIGLYYNNYALSIYNTTSVGPVVWYAEVAFKDRDIYFDPDAERRLYSGETTLGKFDNQSGTVLYSSLSVGLPGVGITLEYKRTENFNFRSDPFVVLNRGLINFLPPMSKVNTFRLKSRYTPATREIAEEAFQLELRYALSKKWKVVQYFSNITDLSGDLLYREIDNEILFRKNRFFQFTFGFQAQEYNQAIYEGKTGVPSVKTMIPYLEWLQRFKKRRSLRLEWQYMASKEDFGSWMFALAEYTVAPKWSFSVSDMYNIDPKKTGDLHYPRVDVVFIDKANRYALSYVKQVEGVVCAGGICRLEPAFSGVKFSLLSTF